MTAYYNEIDRYAAQWLRNLIADGLIPAGDVDGRSIADVRPDDLRSYVQCHFFAGLGGWAYACRLAGWPDERPLWTGSCPCQPFSVAGKGTGVNDKRHLWPDFFRLIRSVRPPVVMGEQVAGTAGYGWLDGVRSDLAGEGYASRGVDIPACAVDAPHIRNRIYWVAVADASCSERWPQSEGRPHEFNRADAGRQEAPSRPELDGRALGNTELLRRDQGFPGNERGEAGERCASRSVAHRPNGTSWSDAEWLRCADGKSRRVEPGIRLMAYGVRKRVFKLRALGNAIVPQVAAEVISAFMECAP